MSLRFLSYRSSNRPQGAVGLLNSDGSTVTPLNFPSGAPIPTLFDLIEEWDKVADSLLPGSPTEDVSAVEILAPLTGRDILAVGKNYKAHAREFQRSGYDSSDKNEQPDFPVIFTKRASSIVPTGAEIYTHPSVTSSIDYEGELGIIIGKAGLAIKKEDAWKHVWGAVIVNDVTARERQRDHKQFYIGKSLDTFCPMGPYAVPASVLDWKNLELETKVNGEIRQKQNTSELIFDIPTLIETTSAGITLQPGDVIATGTPAGVGIGKNPPIFLKSGDKVEVTITGLGTLTNVVSPSNAPAPVCAPVRVKPSNLVTHIPNASLRAIPTGQKLHIEVTEPTSSPTAEDELSSILFIHGLGGSSTNYGAVIAASGLGETHRIVTFDLEGHGLSPLSGGDVTIEEFAESARGVLDLVGVKKTIVVAHSMGGLIATTLAAKYPDRVSKLFLIGPVKSFPEAGFKALSGRAATVRQGGLPAIADAVTQAGCSKLTLSSRPLSKASVRASLLATPPEGYALACLALANAKDPDYARIKAEVVIFAADEDKTSPEATVEFLRGRIAGAEVVRVENVGHWHLVEDVEGTAKALKAFVGK